MKKHYSLLVNIFIYMFIYLLITDYSFLITFELSINKVTIVFFLIYYTFMNIKNYATEIKF